MHKVLLPAVLSLLIAVPSFAQLDDVLKRAEKTLGSQGHDTSGLSDTKISSGLREALRVSSSRAVAYTGRPDGFLKNQAIKIMLPDKLRTVGNGLRMVGMGAKVDELEVGMNRAAEQATPAAKQIFLNALEHMTFEDARRILTGGDTAATDFFKRTSTPELTTAFSPVVKRSMARVGVVKQYNTMLQSAPGGTALAGSFDIDKYVLGKTLEGLFFTLGEEEKKIRKDPAAQTTSLLKEVFGRH